MVLLSIFPAVRILKRLCCTISLFFFLLFNLVQVFFFSSQNYYCHAQDGKICMYLQVFVTTSQLSVVVLCFRHP